MIIVHKDEFAGSRDDLQAALDAFRGEIAAHALTVGEPAPVPALPVVGRIVQAGGGFVMASEIEPEAEAPTGERDAILAQLSALDRDVPRVLEDVISAMAVELPQAAKKKVARKAELRAALAALAE